ncbi:sn-glycerol-3-phosphate ABC transporter ATP-binding protein UgpC [Agrobacterium rhizogenes]|uniref:ABC transporter ATP-binding protein n=1 Tax=Rhizobium rhizogenes TaxID=359 RepID=UPI0022B65553|nr:sn-glycerol-3-phosphate ABC transporter ATP-binding protein UgpC [Rhizobium rhizogenes]MCZ7447266.1 sn-glycerol-3-phosphate ABC transporter ATP-binding protein UgpC [Rhizobium rhizogenes]
MADIVLEKVNKLYQNGYHAIKDLSLQISDGEILILVGPSGCGKSTALRTIAGLEDIDSGDIRIGGRSIVDVDAKDRNIAMVFQNYALYPHLSVFDNIAFSMQLAKVPKREIAQRVQAVARILDLEAQLDRKPGQLSGGQRQRVAMGRAIVRQPAAFLMDEPLSNLDAKLRVYMRAEICRLQREIGVTTVYVTHDQTEAMTMGDRVAVLKDGVLQQVDTPKNLYDNPKNAFVAGFIGSPSMNLMAGHLSDRQLQFGTQRISLPEPEFESRPALSRYNNKDVVIGIRPEDLHDPKLALLPLPTFRAQTLMTEELGAECIVHFTTDAKYVDSGDPDMLEVKGAGHSAARFGPRSNVHANETIDIALDPSKLHFFDPATHAAI